MIKPKLKVGDKVTTCANQIISVFQTKTKTPTKCKSCIASCKIIYTIASVEESGCESGFSVTLIEPVEKFNKPGEFIFEGGGSMAWFNKVPAKIKNRARTLQPKSRFELIIEE